MTRFIVIAALTVAALPSLSVASTDEEWEKFRQTVEKSCSELAEVPQDAKVTVTVNPFGSESYGVALVTVDAGDEGQDVLACIYDKKSQKVELTGPFTPADQTN